MMLGSRCLAGPPLLRPAVPLGTLLPVPVAHHGLSQTVHTPRLLRSPVLVHARPRKSSQTPEPHSEGSGVVSEQDVERFVGDMSYADIQRSLRVLGLPSTGKKADLAVRLTQARLDQENLGQSPAAEPASAQQQQQQQQQWRGQEVQDGPEDMEWEDEDFQQQQQQQQQEPQEDFYDDGGDFAEGSGDLAALRTELAAMPTDEIVKMLEEMGENVQGTREELIQHLAQAVVAEMRREAEGASQPGPSAQADTLLSAQGRTLTDQEKALLLQARRQAAAEETQFLTRPMLYAELKEIFDRQGKPRPSYGSRSTLSQLLADVRAEASLEEDLSQASTDSQVLDNLLREADELAQDSDFEQPAEEESYLEEEPRAVTGMNNSGILLTEENADPAVISSMPGHEIRKLRQTELRSALSVLGLSLTGNKYDMVERLIAHNTEAAESAKRSVMPQMQAFEGMDVRQLRSELQQRGLDVTGSRAALMERLAEQLAREDAALKEGADEEAAEAAPVAQLQPMSPDLRVVRGDPPMTLTVLLGAPGGTLLDLEASLTMARCTVDSMHTSWPAPALCAARDAVNGANPTADPPSSSTSHPGVHVRLLHLRDDLSSVELPQSSLHGLGAAELSVGAVPVLEGGARFGSLEDLQSGLQSFGPDAHALLSSVSLTGLSAQHQAELCQVLGSSGVAVVGGVCTPVQAAALAGDKLRLRGKLAELGFPLLPAWQMVPPDLQSMENWAAEFDAFVGQQGWHRERQVYVVKPSRGNSGRHVVAACGTEDAVQTAREVLQGLMPTDGQPLSAAEIPAVIIEPYMGQEAVNVSVTVIEGPEGPLALLPTEIESADVDTQILKSEIAQQEWLMMKAGMGPQMIQENVSQMMAATTFADARLMSVSQRGLTPFTRMVRYHSPARLSRKMLHHVRHGAALLFSELGLKGAARMDGWVELQPNWEEVYEREDDGIPRLLGDQDPIIVEQMMDEVVKADETLPGPPLGDYYGMKSCKANLSKFSPKERMSTEEGTIFLTSCSIIGLHGPELDPAGPFFQQAAELGIPHAALIRNLVNIALRSSSESKPSTQEEQAGTTALAMPPPKDPEELAVMQHAKPDELDIWAAITEWRHERRMADIDEEMDQAAGLRRGYHIAELAEDALADRAPEQLPPSAFALDWDEEFDSRPPDQATMEKEGPYTDDDAWRERVEQKLAIEELAEQYPGLPGHDLIYVKMGHGPEGQAIDFEKLQKMLRERAEVGDEYIPVDALQACYIDEEAEQEEKELEGFELDPYKPLPPGVDGEELAAKILAKQRREELAALRELGEPTRTGEWGKVLTPTGFGPVGEPEIIQSSQHRLDPRAAAAIAADEMKYQGIGAQKVWVLCGGHHESATTSLRAGLSIALQLQQCNDVQVDLFLLSYSGTGRNEEHRRRALLKRRNEWLATGIPEEELTESMTLDTLRNTAPFDGEPHEEFVWALPMASVLQHSADSAHSMAERLTHLATTAQHTLPTLEVQALEVQAEVQRELSSSGIEGIGGLWGGNPLAPPIPPRCMQLSEFAAESLEAEAVVLPMVRGWMGSSGILQEVLQHSGVVFAGCGPTATMLCGDKQATLEVAEELGEESGITALPSKLLAVEELMAAGNDDFTCRSVFLGMREAMEAGADEEEDEEGREEAADEDEEEEEEDEEEDFERGFQRTARAASESGEGFAPVILRPCDGAGGVGVALIATPEDLGAYGKALVHAAPFIPAGALSLPQPQLALHTHALHQPTLGGRLPPVHGPIPMPRFPPAAFLVQPFMGTDRVEVQPGGKPTVSGDAGWLEVSIGLLGGVGAMEPLGLSLLAFTPAPTPTTPADSDDTSKQGISSSSSSSSQQQQQQEQEQQQDGERGVSTEGASHSDWSNSLEQGVRLYLTPAPAHILGQGAVEAAQLRARAMADHMGLQGLVRVDAFVNRQDGTLVVIECDATPDLNASSMLYQQALRHPTKPMAPAELLRELVNLGFKADVERTRSPDYLGMLNMQIGTDAALVSGDVDAEAEEAEEGELDEWEEGEPAEGLGQDDVEEEGGLLTEEELRAAAAEGSLVDDDEYGVEDERAAMQDMAAAQGLGVPVPGGGDQQELYLSSTGRAQRRSSGATGEYAGSAMADDDDVFDDMGEAEDSEYQSNWNIGRSQEM